MPPQFSHAIIKLPENTLSGDIIQIALGISRIGVFDSSPGRLVGKDFDEGIISRSVPDSDRIPGFGFQLQVDFSIRVFIQLVRHKPSLPGRDVAIDASVIAIDKIGLLRQCRNTGHQLKNCYQQLSHTF
jgi:hypothetical protein